MELYFDESSNTLRQYDNTYDITIHCESQEDYDDALRIINRFSADAPEEVKEGEPKMSAFKCVWMIPPIDFWAGAMIANAAETKRVLNSMPEEPRCETVYVTYVPGDTNLQPVYICKADNNGDTYLFADEDVLGFLEEYAECIRRMS